MSFAVNYWGSNPSAGNDDCYTGTDCETLEQALATFNAPFDGDNDPYLGYCYDYCVAWIELDGPGIYRKRRNPSFDAKRCRAEREAHAREWQREIANEAGMGLGIEAYNDAMGW